MGGPRKLSLALTAAICAAVLAACGGGDDSTSTSATDSTTATSTTGAGSDSTSANPGGTGDDKQQGSTGNGKGQGEDTGDGQGGASGGGNSDGRETPSRGLSSNGNTFTGPPTKHEHPEPVEGKRSATFIVPGGDNSIQTYGEETDAAEREAAMVPIAALYSALEGGDWSEVCNNYLSAPNVEQLNLLAEKSPQMKGKSCAELLGGLNQSTGRKGPDTPDGGLVSFRVSEDTGFAIYWGIDGKGYAFALKSEGGAWKLTSLAPTPLGSF